MHCHHLPSHMLSTLQDPHEKHMISIIKHCFYNQGNSDLTIEKLSQRIEGWFRKYSQSYDIKVIVTT